MAGNIFTKHPTEIGETYGQHLVSALIFGVKMVAAGIGCIIHAFLPFLFETAGSGAVSRLHRGMSKRVEKPNWERHPII